MFLQGCINKIFTSSSKCVQYSRNLNNLNMFNSTYAMRFFYSIWWFIATECILNDILHKALDFKENFVMISIYCSCIDIC